MVDAYDHHTGNRNNGFLVTTTFLSMLILDCKVRLFSAVFSTLAQGMGISLITVAVNLWQIFFSITAAYELGFVFLGLLMIFPIIEELFLPGDIGHATIG